MNEIRIQKIDGQEFVPYKDYQKLKSDYDRLDKVASENVRTLDELNAEIIELKEENQKMKEHRSDSEKSADSYITALEEENQKLKYVIDLAMEKAGIEYIRLSDGDVFVNPKNKLHISETIQVDVLNNNK